MPGIAQLIFILSALSGQVDPIPQWDAHGDCQIRRTDAGANGDVGELIHATPDIAGYVMGNWQPANPSVDLYTGAWSPAGLFLRVEIAFFGHLNPPGLLAIRGDLYAPYLYGLNPVFGYIELDLDRNVASGGESAFPERRYLWNAARFGGLPSVPRFLTNNRFAANWFDLDHTISTPPYVERSGEEFHIALFGDWIDQVIEITGDGDGVFEEGEVWLLRGQLFHRAHAFETFSAAGGDGVYQPVVDLRFENPAGSNLTFVTLVYPLTNAGSAQQNGSATTQPNDGNDTNQNSIEEALFDLKASVQRIVANGSPLQNHPAYPLISPWGNENPAGYLNSTLYFVDMLVGMAYTNEDPSGTLCAWTDAWPDCEPGDFNGDGRVNMDDVQMLNTFISQYDGSADDADGVVNGSVAIPNFGPNYSIFDLNYDGWVNNDDRRMVRIPGDLNGDFLLNAMDVNLLVGALVNPGGLPGGLPSDFFDRADLNHDGTLDGRDIRGMVQAFLGN